MAFALRVDVEGQTYIAYALNGTSPEMRRSVSFILSLFKVLPIAATCKHYGLVRRLPQQDGISWRDDAHCIGLDVCMYDGRPDRNSRFLRL